MGYETAETFPCLEDCIKERERLLLDDPYLLEFAGLQFETMFEIDQAFREETKNNPDISRWVRTWDSMREWVRQREVRDEFGWAKRDWRMLIPN